MQTRPRLRCQILCMFTRVCVCMTLHFCRCSPEIMTASCGLVPKQELGGLRMPARRWLWWICFYEHNYENALKWISYGSGSALSSEGSSGHAVLFFFLFLLDIFGVWPSEMIAGVLPVWPGLIVHITLRNTAYRNKPRCPQGEHPPIHFTDLKMCTSAEQETGVPDVKPVMNFVPLVITTLEFPYRGATAPRACVPGWRVAYPDRRRLVLHSFSEQDPPIS